MSFPEGQIHEDLGLDPNLREFSKKIPSEFSSLISGANLSAITKNFLSSDETIFLGELSLFSEEVKEDSFKKRESKNVLTKKLALTSGI